MEVVPIVEIDGDSLSELRPMLLAAVRMAQYVSIDLELSGLGDKPDIRYVQNIASFPQLKTQTFRLQPKGHSKPIRWDATSGSKVLDPFNRDRML